MLHGTNKFVMNYSKLEKSDQWVVFVSAAGGYLFFFCSKLAVIY